MCPSNTDIQIVEYTTPHYYEVVSLFDELQSHISSLDLYRIQSLGEEYHSRYFSLVERTVEQAGGKMLVALHHDTVVGFAAGVIEQCDEIDLLTTTCPKKGRVMELIVSKSSRRHGIGQLLMRSIESFLLSAGCEYIYVDVFAPNAAAAEFYSMLGYEMRNVELIKALT